MPALQRGAAWADERLLDALRQSVPQNGLVHLHIIEKTGRAKGRGQIGKIPKKNLVPVPKQPGKSQNEQKRTNRDGQVQIGNATPFEPPVYPPLNVAKI